MKHRSMYRLGVSLTVLMVVSNIACAQQGSGPQAQQGTVQHRQGDAIENACRQELRRICSLGFPPDVSLVHRCIADNQEKLSAPCRALFRERQKSMTHSPGVEPKVTATGAGAERK
jgi:hypothetical protein